MTHSDLWRAIDKMVQQTAKMRAARAKEQALATPVNGQKLK